MSAILDHDRTAVVRRNFLTNKGGLRRKALAAAALRDTSGWLASPLVRERKGVASRQLGEGIRSRGAGVCAPSRCSTAPMRSAPLVAAAAGR